MTKKLNELTPMERNIRIHTDAQIAEMIRSIEKFGQIRPIVIDENGMIMAGHGLWMALVQMGREEGNVLEIKNLTENEKIRLMLADNKLFQLGQADNELMAKLIEEIGQEDGTFDIPGFNEQVLSEMFAFDETIDEIITDYGKVSEERIEEIRQAGEDIRVKIEEESEKPKVIELNPEVIKVDEKDDRPFVTCPDCGTKIWL